MKRLVLVASAAVLACSESVPNEPTPREPASFGILPALDTAGVGDTVLFVAARADSTVDEWTVSDSGLARLIAQQPGRATVLTRAAGTVTIKATRQADSGQATLVVVPAPPPPPPPPSPFGIRPAVDTVVVGDTAFFVAERADSTVDVWSVNDSSNAYPLARPGGRVAVLASASGTVTVKATRQGASGQATLVVVPQPPPPPQTFGDWEAIDLGLMDACGGDAAAINDSGTIVGRLTVGCYHTAYTVGFVYKDGVMRKLPRASTYDVPQVIGPFGAIAGLTITGLAVWDTPDAAPRILETTQLDNIVGVNERGDVLEVEERGAHINWGRSVLWRHDLRVELGELGDSALPYRPSTWATAWNSSGQIVGESQVGDSPIPRDPPSIIYHAFLWEDGITRDLGVLAQLPCTSATRPADADCGWSSARDINAQGVVVGQANDTAGIPRAVVWDHGVIRELGVSPGHWTIAWAINDRGQILGVIGNGTSFYWENGQVQLVGTLFLWENGQVQLIAADTDARAIALSPNGEVIGSMTVGGEHHAFVWYAGQLTDLGPGTLAAINNRSEIVGERHIAGHYRPTLWRKKR